MISRPGHTSPVLLDLEMLGPLQVAADGGPISLSARKGLALLAYLGQRVETSVPRETVRGLLWSDSGEDQAKASLRQALTTLRKCLGPASAALGADKDRLSLNRSLVRTDVAEFLNLAKQDTNDALEQAAALYRGDLLEGIGPVTPEFDRWLDAERSAIRATYFSVLEKLCKSYAGQGRQEEVITYVSLILRLDPLREDMHRTLMCAFLKQNRFDAALKQFASLQDILKRELDIAPDPETMELVREVRASRSRKPDREATPDPAAWQPKPAPPVADHTDGKPSIAVLPLLNMSDDPEQDYFCDGISEDIITELSRFGGLFVIARNSSFTFKNRSFTHQDVARELGVRYMVEGGIRRAGNRVRISVQMIECASGAHIWAERYDRHLEDIFELQDEITRSVVGAIAPQIELAEIDRVLSKRDIDFTSYDLALQAKAIFHDGGFTSQEGFERTVSTARHALELDPGNMDALWIEAYACTMRYLYQIDETPEIFLDQAETAVRKLFASDRPDPHALSVRGMIQHFRGNFAAATADLQRSFELNPNFALNIFFLSWHESLVDRTEDAKAHAQLALRLSPRDSDLWVGDAYLSLAQANFAEGRFEDAQVWGERAIQFTPKAPIRRALMIACAAHLGRPAEAQPHVEALAAFAPGFLESIVSGRLVLYQKPEHNGLLISGIRKSGSLASSQTGAGLAAPDRMPPQPLAAHIEAAQKDGKARVYLLPFEARGAEASGLVDAIRDDVATAFARQSGIVLVVDPEAADYEVSCALRGAPPRWRLSANLLDRRKQRVVWSDRFNETGDDQFDIQDRFVSRIVGAVRIRLPSLIAEELSNRPLDSMDVGELLNFAMHQHMRFVPDSWARARDALEQVLQRDPGNWMAMTMLSYNLMSASRIFGWRRLEASASDRAHQLITAALDLRPNSEVARAVHGNYLLYVKRDHPAALYEAEASVGFNPDYYGGTDLMGQALLFSGDLGKARAYAEHCANCDPGYPYLHLYLRDLALLEYAEGNYEKALELYRRANVLAPSMPQNLAGISICSKMTGQDQQAANAMQNLLSLDASLRAEDFDPWPFADPSGTNGVRDLLIAAGMPC